MLAKFKSNIAYPFNLRMNCNKLSEEKQIYPKWWTKKLKKNVTSPSRMFVINIQIIHCKKKKKKHK